MIDPKQRQKERDERGGGRAQQMSAGRRLGAIVGWEWYNSSVKGTPALDVRFVCVVDPSPAEEVGFIHTADFYLTSGALFKLADLAIALGWTEPFDESNAEDMEKVFGSNNGIVWLNLKPETYNGKTRVKLDSVDRFGGQQRPDVWDPVIKGGEAGFARYLQWRENNPRGSKPAGGGNRPSGGGHETHTGGGGAGAPDEDIPF